MFIPSDHTVSLSFQASRAVSVSFPGRFSLICSGSELSFSLFYEGHVKPLVLTSAVREGDPVRLVLRDYRIELWTNGQLADEEWPDGAALFCGIELPDEVFSLSELPPDEDVPSVVSTFEHAEGWMPGEGVFVGDCMPYTSDGRYHILYLKDRHHHQSKWGKGAHQWEHLSTDDFVRFQVHPMAVPIDRSWEGSICTGSHIDKDGRHYLYYTIRTMDDSPAPICRSVSEDGYHFKKDPSFSFTLSEKYHRASARDPKLLRAEDGLFHMFVTSTLVSAGKGCLVHLTSSDLTVWHEEDQPIFLSDTADQPECPDYFAYHGKYYLVFSLCGIGQYRFSEQPFSNFRTPDNPVIPCESVPKGAVFHDKIVFTGFRRIHGYAGTMTFASAEADSDGALIFAKT